MTLVIGLSATPTRTKKTEDLGDKFNHLVQAPPVHELMEMGRLVPEMRYWGFSAGGSIDTSSVHTRAGDFAADELEVASDRPELLHHAVVQWRRLADGLRTLSYCVSIKHAENMAETFNANGIPAAVVTGSTPRDERQEIYRQLADREIFLIASVNVLSIGFDLPCAEALICARPTKSIAVHLQQLGRGARAHPGKTSCLVLDQAGNVMRHGPLEADRDWSLKKGDEPGGMGGGGFPMKQCVNCGHLMAPQHHLCPACGAEQPVIEKNIRTDNLVEIKFDKAETKRMKQLHRWIAKAYRQGYLNGWVLRMWEQKFTNYGHPPAEMWRGAIFENPTEEDATTMATHWGRICRKKNRSWPIALTAITREFAPEFMDTLDVASLRLAWLDGYSQAPN